MKVIKMDKLEILEAEIKRKIFYIKSYLLKLPKTDIGQSDNTTKYLKSISNLEKENAELKCEREKIGEEHEEDLKQIENLVAAMSKFVENNDA